MSTIDPTAIAPDPFVTMAEEQDQMFTVDTTRRPQTPSLPTPTGSKTPPTISSKRFMATYAESGNAQRRMSETAEADALARRLKEIENASRQRDFTPGRSPSRKRQRVYGDRLVHSC